jgi:ADP-heptose:LPS heptosyltransferase
MASPRESRILVIKLGALGDFVQALGPFAAIRNHHGQSHVTLLTTHPFVSLAEASGWFDAVWTDDRPRGLRPGPWLSLRRRLRDGNFTRVYDLQTSDRSSFYFRLLWPGPAPEWSGIARGCSHPHANPRRDFLHTIERQAEQLAMAGLEKVPAPDVSWVKGDIAPFGVPERFALLVPGGAPHRPAKRWPAERFAELGQVLSRTGITPVLLGTPKEEGILSRVREACPQALDLSGQTTLPDIALLARKAALAVGNDTGPMHLIAVAGCPSVVLYSHESDPALCAQRGPRVTILRRPLLADLTVDDVAAELNLVGKDEG